MNPKPNSTWGEVVAPPTDPSVLAMQRTVRRRRLFAKQFVLLGWIVLGMAAITVVAIPFATGIITLPYGNTFTLSEEAKAKAPPCPPSGTPVALTQVKTSIYNGSSRNGLAKETAERLKTFGVGIEGIGNASESYAGSARITTGRAGIAKAYSLSRALPDSEVRIDLSKKDQIKVLLGEQFQGALSKEILGGGELGSYPEPTEKCSKLG